MRQAINNLQATFTGFGEVSKEYVYLVCDVPAIDDLKAILAACIAGSFDMVNNFLRAREKGKHILFTG
jgi:hypothetical protein